MNFSIHNVQKMEIEAVDGPFSGALCRSIVITHDGGQVLRIDLFAKDAISLALNLKRREVLRGEEGDSASAPDAAVATSEVAL